MMRSFFLVLLANAILYLILTRFPLNKPWTLNQAVLLLLIITSSVMLGKEEPGGPVYET